MLGFHFLYSVLIHLFLPSFIPMFFHWVHKTIRCVCGGGGGEGYRALEGGNKIISSFHKEFLVYVETQELSFRKVHLVCDQSKNVWYKLVPLGERKIPLIRGRVRW